MDGDYAGERIGDIKVMLVLFGLLHICQISLGFCVLFAALIGWIIDRV